MRQHRGLALIIVVGVLGVLAMLDSPVLDDISVVYRPGVASLIDWEAP